MSIKKFDLKSFDKFGKSVEFNIMGNYKVKSLCGGILTFILIFLFFLIFSYNISKFAQREPQVTLYNEAFDIDSVQLIPFNFKFLTTIMEYDNSINSPIKASPYNSESYNYKTGETSNYTEIGNFVSCDMADLNLEDYDSYFNDIGREYFTCLNLYKDIKNVTLGGSIFGKQGQYEVSLYYTQNITNSVNGYMFFFSIMNNIIDVKNSSGYKSFLDSYNIWIERGSKIRITNKIVKNILRTDVNLIYNVLPPNQTSFYTHNIEIVDQIKLDNNNSIDVEIIFQINSINNLYNRSYMNIDTLLANSFSICQVVIFIIKILDYFLNYYTLKYNLIERLYIIDEEEKFSKSKYITSRLVNHNNKPLRTLNASFKKINNHNILNIFSNIIYNKNKTKSILKMGLKLLEHDLNLVLILRKLIEYENLKYILLDNYQIKCLNLTNRRILGINNEEKMMKKINEEYEANNLLLGNHIFNNDNHNKIDIKLKEMLS